MSKRNIQQSGRGPTRRQIARSRREREQLRLIYIGLGIVAALVVIVLAFGFYQTYVLEPQEPVAIVDGQEITTADYQDRVQYERFILQDQYQQIVQQQAALAESENEQLVELLGNQYQQMANQILQQLSVIDRQTVDTMIDDELIKAEAAERGLTASEEEVTEYINRTLARRAGGLTAASASETATARVQASATATLWTPTPTLTPSPTITITGEITPTATPVDTPTPQPTPTFNVIDAESLSTEYGNWLEILAENAGIGEAEYRQIVRTFVLRDKLAEALGDEVSPTAEQARARHILVETEEEAKEVIERLEAGEEFADLATELSTDPGSAANGGDLGFVPSGRFVEPIDEAVFSLPLGEISEPIETQFGWHVVEVLEREERELSPADYQQSQQLAFSEWLENARAEADIQDLWTADKAPDGSLFTQQ